MNNITIEKNLNLVKFYANLDACDIKEVTIFMSAYYNKEDVCIYHFISKYISKDSKEVFGDFSTRFFDTEKEAKEYLFANADVSKLKERFGEEIEDRDDIFQRDDFEWFTENYDELYKKFKCKDRYVAISRRKIIDYTTTDRDKDFGILFHRVIKKHKIGTFIIQSLDGKRTDIGGTTVNWPKF